MAKCIAKYKSGPKKGRCKKYSGRRKRKASKRRAAGMAKKGSKCTRFKRVRVRGGGMQRRCARYGR